MEGLLTKSVIVHILAFSASMRVFPDVSVDGKAESETLCNECKNDFTEKYEYLYNINNCERLRSGYFDERKERSLQENLLYGEGRSLLDMFNPWESWSEWDCVCGIGQRTRWRRQCCSSGGIMTCTQIHMCPINWLQAGEVDTLYQCTELFGEMCCGYSKLT